MTQKTRWQEWQEKNNEKIASTQQVLNLGDGFSEKASLRYGICTQCPAFISKTTQCKECGCIMINKVKIDEAFCPLAKW